MLKGTLIVIAILYAVTATCIVARRRLTRTPSIHVLRARTRRVV